VISTFGAISIVTRALIGPFLTAMIFPERMLRALIFIGSDDGCKEMSRVKNQVSSGAPEIEYNESISRSTRQRVENDRRAASAEAAAPGSVETLHLSQVFTGGPQSNGHAMVFGVAPNPALGG
jgi:hypothetical protein